MTMKSFNINKFSR